ncbi:glycerol-3-phosphate dehydrogenase subunit GlpB [Halorussus gelatinilyticus]|uniref:Glycerol-3-phosphate dehydrogenase subunit GlpB n=1 Tax=Halorussus gelatinilyticus TaxID=2937524 RepID=A0A8U0IGW2_9EURY|nr:glycerol-3-phosphate dehydrogenase subunit GlpB [Halorussus gelatinilyticus]UPW00307.1 glycerol-3-phosphate dehydrogenase subunit GlpB [Halorussus gelatinilyticus]
MAIEDDVTVVGGGLAGMTAALAAARDGAEVRVLSHKDSTLKSASGLVDVLGYRPRSAAADERGAGSDESANDADRGEESSPADGPLADPFDAIPDLPESHPYRTVGVEGVRDALALFDEVVGDRYRGSHTDRNALVPTHVGSVKPTARYPATAAAGLASDDRSALLVGFETVTDFDAPLAAAHLESAGVPFAARGATIAFPGDFRVDAKITRFADALDANERVAVEGDGYTTELPVRTALAEAVKPHLRGEERVGFPAILGQHDPAEVCADLESELGAAVFEVPMGPPSLPGMRLEGAFLAACREAGVRFTTGNPVVDYETGDGTSGGSGDETGDGDGDAPGIAAVRVERNGAAIPFHADQFVLATGGLVGKGIDSDRESVEEPIFDCHVPHSRDRYDWFADDAFGDHPFARFGVETDDDLRPLDREGDVEFSNLRAAGAVLGGYDFAAEKSGAGVSLATGVAAGRSAAREVTR